jgi:hypothetical protein
VITAKVFVEWQPVAFGLGAIVLSQAPNGLMSYVKVPPLGDRLARSAWRLESSRHRARVGAAMEPVA